MTKERIERRDVHGFILLDKPTGISSNKALQRVKWLLRARKAGHTGSLDPLASGLLPLAFGDATRLGSYLLDASKSYEAEISLGARTSTGDAEGEVVETQPVPQITVARWHEILDEFIGETEQIPPMYSALKHEGQRLYKLAREGSVVDRPPRPVIIDEIELLSADQNTMSFTVTCSKGTYVRTLAEDIAIAAGTCGHLTRLRRTGIGRIPVGDAIPLAEIETRGEALEAALLPLDCAVTSLPRVDLSAAEAIRFVDGQRLRVPLANQDGVCRIYNPDGILLGLGRSEQNQLIRPEKVLAGQKIAAK